MSETVFKDPSQVDLSKVLFRVADSVQKSRSGRVDIFYEEMDKRLMLGMEGKCAYEISYWRGISGNDEVPFPSRNYSMCFTTQGGYKQIRRLESNPKKFEIVTIDKDTKQVIEREPGDNILICRWFVLLDQIYEKMYDWVIKTMRRSDKENLEFRKKMAVRCQDKFDETTQSQLNDYMLHFKIAHMPLKIITKKKEELEMPGTIFVEPGTDNRMDFDAAVSLSKNHDVYVKACVASGWISTEKVLSMVVRANQVRFINPRAKKRDLSLPDLNDGYEPKANTNVSDHDNASGDEFTAAFEREQKKQRMASDEQDTHSS